jgi:hypothetical protein
LASNLIPKRKGCFARINTHPGLLGYDEPTWDAFLRQVSPGGGFLLNYFLPIRANSATEVRSDLDGINNPRREVWTKE